MEDQAAFLGQPIQPLTKHNFTTWKCSKLAYAVELNLTPYFATDVAKPATAQEVTTHVQRIGRATRTILNALGPEVRTRVGAALTPEWHDAAH